MAFNKKTYKIIICTLVFCLLFTGCLNSKDANLKGAQQTLPKEGGTLHLAGYSPDTLNPLSTEYSCIRDYLYLAYEGLFIVNEDLTVKGVLATEYKAKDNNTHYTIKLKKGVKFHDGTAFTSKDVIATFDYLKTYGGYYSNLLDNVTSYKADGDYGVEIYLNSPINNFVCNLDFPILPSGLGARDFAVPNSDFSMNGTGRYMYEKVNPYTSLIMCKNPSWHGETPVYIPKVCVRYVNDNDAIVYAFDSGETDMVTTERARWGEYSYTASHNIYEITTTKYVFVGFNTVNTAFSDVELRRSIESLVDKEDITDSLMFSHATVARNPISSKAYFYRDSEDKKIKTDKDYIKGKKLSSYILYNEEDKQKEDIAKYLKKILEDAGIKIKLTKVDYESYLKKIQKGDYSIYIGKIDLKRDCNLDFMFAKEVVAHEQSDKIAIVNPDEIDKSETSDSVLASKSAIDDIGKICNYANVSLNDIINSINSAKNEETLKVAYNNLCAFYDEHAMQIPLYHINDAILVSTRIKGKVTPNLTNFYADIGEIYIN